MSEDALTRTLLEQTTSITGYEGRAEERFIRGEMVRQIVDLFRKRFFNGPRAGLVLDDP